MEAERLLYSAPRRSPDLGDYLAKDINLYGWASEGSGERDIVDRIGDLLSAPGARLRPASAALSIAS